jgi:plastocyanin
VALLDGILLVGVGLWFGDRESLVLGALLIVVALAIALLPRLLGLLSLLAAGALFVDVAAWMVPAAWWNLSRREQFVDVSVPAVLATMSVLGLVAIVMALLRRDVEGVGPEGPVVVIGAGVIVLIGLLITAGVRGTGVDRVPRPGDLVLRAHDMEFSTDHLDASAGTVAVHFSNRDLFWHTFTVRELDVDLWVSARGERRAVFDAPPGQYEFVCAVPGHETSGMEGTLVVK